MTYFKKIAPLFLAAVFAFAAAPAFSQVQPTGVAECDQFITEYINDLAKGEPVVLSAKQKDERLQYMDKILGIGDALRSSLASGETTRQEAASDCKKMLNKLKSDADVD